METSVTPLNHYFESQVLQSEGHIQQQQQQQQLLPQQIQLQQPTTSNLRQTIHIHNNQQVQITNSSIANTISSNNNNNNIVNGISNNNNCVQPNQIQHVFSQPANSPNFALNSSNNQQTVFVTNSIQTPTTTSAQFQPLPEVPPSIQTPSQPIQNPYQFKCSLLDYHIHEAVLINKALRSELQVYKEKIEFEKKLRALLIERVKNYSS